MYELHGTRAASIAACAARGPQRRLLRLHRTAADSLRYSWIMRSARLLLT
jgi:hypothetical protein